MKKSRKSPVFHKGDKVKIIKPEIFVRCGYPKSKLDFPVSLEEREKIKSLLVSFVASSEFYDYRYDCSLDKICDEVSYLRLLKNNFGGYERKIHTFHNDRYIDIIGEVISKRIVKTGTYDYGYLGYDGDSCPPCLKNESSHIILTLNVSYSYSASLPYIIFEIEETNVIKI